MADTDFELVPTSLKDSIKTETLLYSGGMSKNTTYTLNQNYTDFKSLIIRVQNNENLEKYVYVPTSAISSSCIIDCSILTEVGSSIYVLVRLQFTAQNEVKAQNIDSRTWSLSNVAIWGTDT